MNIILVDDDPLVSMSLKIILEQDSSLTVIDTFTSGNDVITAIKNGTNVDVILMDIRMDGLNGIETTEEIFKITKSPKVIFLTTFLDDEYIGKALSIGASGYILKQDCSSIQAAIHAVMSGQFVYGSKIVEKLPDLLNRHNSFDYEKYNISEREQEVIKLVADGLSNKEIADKMFLGEGTIRNMVSIILNKLELRDRTQLAIFYYQKIQ